MTSMDNHTLIKKLLSASEQPNLSASTTSLSDDIRRIFLKIGSETDDNLNCCEHIEYGAVRKSFSSKNFYGLKVKGKNLLISEVMNAVEDLEIPQEVKAYFPDLTGNEWSAVTRMITMILLELEYKVSE